MIKPNDTMTVEDMGMPFHKTPYKSGNLFVNFTIAFPDQINQKQITQVKDILSDQKAPASAISELNSVETKIEMKVFDES